MRAGRHLYRPRTFLLMGICGVLTVLLVHLWRAPLQSAEVGEVVASGRAIAPPDFSVQAFGMPSKDTFVEMWKRPLFRQSRRPAAAKPVVAVPVKVVRSAAPKPKPLPKLRQLSLVGIAVIGDRRLALLRQREGRDVLQVVEGEALDGWRIEAIDTEAVIFRLGSSQQRLEFPKPAVRSGPVVAPRRNRSR